MAKMHEHYQQQSKLNTQGSVQLVEKVAYYEGLLRANNIPIPKKDEIEKGFIGIQPFQPDPEFL